MFMPFHKTIVSILTVLFLQSLFVSSVDAQVRILSSGDEYDTISDAVAAGACRVCRVITRVVHDRHRQLLRSHRLDYA